MSNAMLARALGIFTTRLRTLDGLLGKAEAQWREQGRDPEALLGARLAEDMLPLPHQIIFTCNQANWFAAWSRSERWQQPDPTGFDFAGLRRHIAETIERVAAVGHVADDNLLDRDKRVDLLDGMYLELDGQDYLDEWLLPNFYFHLVTAYDLLRMEGVTIGKPDYMTHIADRVRGRPEAA